MKISQKDLLLVATKTNARCFYCNSLGEEVDHFVPKYWWREWMLDDLVGSVDKIENLFLACEKCNRKKLNSYPEDFIGSSYIAWKRYNKANARIGIKMPILYSSPWNNDGGFMYWINYVLTGKEKELLDMTNRISVRELYLKN